jgi:hypothetical protein
MRARHHPRRAPSCGRAFRARPDGRRKGRRRPLRERRQGSRSGRCTSIARALACLPRARAAGSTRAGVRQPLSLNAPRTHQHDSRERACRTTTATSRAQTSRSSRGLRAREPANQGERKGQPASAGRTRLVYGGRNQGSPKGPQTRSGNGFAPAAGGNEGIEGVPQPEKGRSTVSAFVKRTGQPRWLPCCSSMRRAP